MKAHAFYFVDKQRDGRSRVLSKMSVASWMLGSVKDASGYFTIPWLNEGTLKFPFSNLIKWRWTSTPPARPTNAQREAWFPLVTPDKSTMIEKPSITWLGHASCYVRMAGGLRILTDPVFSQRSSPVQWAGPARYVPAPCRVEELPPPHLVLISHDHYDHLDYNTIEALESRAEKPTYAVGLRLREWFLSAFPEIQSDRVLEFDWWQSQDFKVTGQDISAKIDFVPAQHWGSRTLSDRFWRLWGGFVITDSECRKFYFAGDTGFSEELFTEIGKRHGPIDVAAIPIGAYEPRWIMQKQHVNPEEAHHIHRLLRSKISLGIHWGTFILTDEPLTEPRELIEAECQAHPESPPFITLKHGESRLL